jgi:hypothetical protein
MHTISQDNETSLEDERGRWENEGGSVEPAASPTPEKVDQALDAEQEPFPSVMAGKLHLKELKLVRLIDELKQKGRGEGGPAFLVTLFGSTCSKIELLGRRNLGWHDYLAAMKRAIEREIGYWQNRGTLLPTGEQQVVYVMVRDEDFTLR